MNVVGDMLAFLDERKLIPFFAYMVGLAAGVCLGLAL